MRRMVYNEVKLLYDDPRGMLEATTMILPRNIQNRRTIAQKIKKCETKLEILPKPYPPSP